MATPSTPQKAPQTFGLTYSNPSLSTSNAEDSVMADDEDVKEEEVVVLTEEDKERKIEEKEAFHKTFGAAVRETTGDDVAYLHRTAPEGSLRTIDGVGT